MKQKRAGGGGGGGGGASEFLIQLARLIFLFN